MDATRRKVMVVAIVIALLSVASIAVLMMPTNYKDNEINIIAQVNQNGSAIIMRGADLDPNDYCTIDEETWEITVDDTQKLKWDGKVIGTPGETTIQHVMLRSFVENTLEMTFAKYSGNNESNGTVYYYPKVSNSSDWMTTASYVNGCIIWEYVASEITHMDAKDRGTSIIDSKYLDKDHACCVIASTHSYLTSNTNATIRFLKGYVDAVKSVNECLKTPGSKEYNLFLDWAKTYTGKSLEITESALKNVKYTYGDEGDVLKNLRASIAKFVSSGDLKQKVYEQGYNSVEEFANDFVNDTYIIQALEDEEITGDEVTIKVASISGDIHQIALHWGKENGFFNEQKIKIEVTPCTNGAAVATSLQNKEADMGFMGVPPITSVVVNSKLDPAIQCELTGTITTSTGAPIKNTKVIITPSFCSKPYECYTDDSGFFTINVPKGTYSYTVDYIKVVIDGKEQIVECKALSYLSKNISLGTLRLKA